MNQVRAVSTDGDDTGGTVQLAPQDRDAGMRSIAIDLQ
jgi:hypothetical protein